MARLPVAKTLIDPETGARLLTSAEAGRYLKYHHVSIRRLVRRGVLRPYSTVGRALLFLEKELDRFRQLSPRARNKAGIDYLPNPPSNFSPRSGMRAVVTIDWKRRPKIFKRIKNFLWADIPAIRTEVAARFGAVTFTVSIEMPDETGCELSFFLQTTKMKGYAALHAGAREGGT